MSLSPPPMAAASPTTEALATMPDDTLTDPIVDSKLSTTSPVQKDIKSQEFKPGCGLAIFSTELGTQPKHAVDRNQLPPVIVRSDFIKGVVDAARVWQEKFKIQCLCIFPGQGWTVDDLWDAADLHLDTPSFCSEMLTFISRDTYHTARKFADDWIRAYPERVATVGSNMAELFNVYDQFSVVDKIYTEGERTDFPRTFLWHVAHMVRATLLEMRLTKDAMDVASHDQKAAHSQHHDKAETQDIADTIKTESPLTTEPSMNETPPVSTVEAALANPAVPPATGFPSEPQYTQTRTLQQESSESLSHSIEPSVNFVSDMNMKSPTVPSQALRVSKSQSRTTGTTAYPQAPQQGWIENVHRSGSRQYPRQQSGGVSYTQSPRFMPANMAMGQPFFPAGYVAPYAHVPPMMAAQMAPMYHFDPHVAQHGLVYPSAMAPTPQFAHGYVHQPHTVRGVSMSDMSNNAFYANGMAHYNVDQRTPVSRRGSTYNAHGTLYDPYNGTNSDFRGPNGYNKSKKNNHNDSAFNNEYPRKISNSGPRPPYGFHNADRALSFSYTGARHSGFHKTREIPEDDPSITGDRLAGCHEHWIGPENGTVDEIFVGDLPVDVQLGEVVQMFEQQMGISPANVSIRFPSKSDRSIQQQDRCHAFVALHSTADAKKVMDVPLRDRDFRLRETANPVSVSVPRRFFQLISESTRRSSFSAGPYPASTQGSHHDGRDGRKIRRESAHDGCQVAEETGAVAPAAKSLYSPQDARSGLRKKSDGKLGSNNAGTAGSPQSLRTKSRQSSPTKHKHGKNKSAAPKNTHGDKERILNPAADDLRTVATTISTGKPIENATGGNITPKHQDAPDQSSTIDSAELRPSVSLGNNKPTSATGNPISQSAEKDKIANRGQGVVEAHTQPVSAPVTSESSNSTVAADVINQKTYRKIDKEESKAVSPPHSPKHRNLDDKIHDTGSGSASQSLEEPHAHVGVKELLEKPIAMGQEKALSTDKPQTVTLAEPKLPANRENSPLVNDKAEDGNATVLQGAKISEARTKAPAASVGAVPAKSVVQQVASLHPYAKPSKYHQKKIKEALKKQQKKEQVEKTKTEKQDVAPKPSQATMSGQDAASVMTPTVEKAPKSSVENAPKSLLKSPQHPPKVKQIASQGKVKSSQIIARASGAAVADDNVQESHCSPKLAKAPKLAEPPIATAPMIQNTMAFEKIDESKVHNGQLPVPKEKAPATTSAIPNAQDSSRTLVQATNLTGLVSADQATPAAKKKPKNKRKKAKGNPSEEGMQEKADPNGKDVPDLIQSASVTRKATNTAANPTTRDSLTVCAADLAMEDSEGDGLAPSPHPCTLYQSVEPHTGKQLELVKDLPAGLRPCLEESPSCKSLDASSGLCPLQAPCADTVPEESGKKKRRAKKNKNNCAEPSQPVAVSPAPHPPVSTTPSTSLSEPSFFVATQMKPIDTMVPHLGYQDPLLMLAKAAAIDRRNEEVRKALKLNKKVYFTKDPEATRAAVEAEHAARGGQPVCTPLSPIPEDAGKEL